MQWIKTNTASNSVLVSDALYGWWLGGFSQRQTLSAVSPEYLTVKREVDNATFARNLMDTDYIVDNGLIQVREDGYLSRHIPEVLIDQNWTYATYSFFTFSSQTKVTYTVGDNPEDNVLLSELQIKEMHIENDTQHATIAVTRCNDYINYTITTTLYRGVRFANITSTITALSPKVSLGSLFIMVESNGEPVFAGDQTIGMIDSGVKALGQLIFDQPLNRALNVMGKFIEADYSFVNKSSGSLQMLTGAYCLDGNPAYWSSDAIRNAHFMPEITKNLASALTPIRDADQSKYDLKVFNYLLELQSRQVDYIVCRDQAVEPKFLNDPSFSLVFINKEVAIFNVHR